MISNLISAETLKPLLLKKINKLLYLQLKRAFVVNLKCPMLCEGISGYRSTTAMRLGKINSGVIPIRGGDFLQTKKKNFCHNQFQQPPICHAKYKKNRNKILGTSVISISPTPYPSKGPK